MSLPLLDFSKLQSESEKERSEFVKLLTESLIQHGAVKLINHGISEEDISSLFSWVLQARLKTVFHTLTHVDFQSKRFFELPFETKLMVANDRNPDPQRGWMYVGSEETSNLTTTSNGRGDHKEHFDCAFTDDTEFPSKWLPEDVFPGFRKFSEGFLSNCERTGLRVLEVLEEGLELEPGQLVKMCYPHVHELRVAYYPPVSLESLEHGKGKRGWPHTDFGVLTLLFQDTAGGLEVENRSCPGSFIPVIRESPSELVIYTADTLERWTNRVIRGGLHQVSLPAGVDEKHDSTLPERYSAACFLKAGRHVSVGPLSKFVEDRQTPEFPDISALELHQLRVGTLYPSTEK